MCRCTPFQNARFAKILHDWNVYTLLFAISTFSAVVYKVRFLVCHTVEFLLFVYHDFYIPSHWIFQDSSRCSVEYRLHCPHTISGTPGGPGGWGGSLVADLMSASPNRPCPYPGELSVTLGQLVIFLWILLQLFFLTFPNTFFQLFSKLTLTCTYYFSWGSGPQLVNPL